MARTTRIPKYRLHKASGQAIVTIKKHDHYLGPHNSPESRDLYLEIIEQNLKGWKPARRRPTLSEIFDEYVETFPSKKSRQSKRAIFNGAKRFFGPDLTVNKLTVGTFIEYLQFLAEKHTNATLRTYRSAVIRALEWGALKNRVPMQMSQEFRFHSTKGKIRGVRRPKVLPVAWELVEAVLPLITPRMQALALILWHTGMRPGELLKLRPCDLDQSEDVWRYLPDSHKNDWRDLDRLVAIGPAAQKILKQHLKGKRREDRAFTVTHSGFYAAIERGCRRAGVQHWFPYQLRHSFAARARKEVGLDAARAALGHAGAKMTEIYAGRDIALASDLARKLG